MFKTIRSSIAKLFRLNQGAPASGDPRVVLVPSRQRMYASARGGSGWTSITSSADAELSSSLTRLRNKSRELVRDAAHAKRAKRIVQNNVVGRGMKLQSRVKDNRGNLRNMLNERIEEAFATWSRAEFCHTGGELPFSEIERLAMGEVFEAGEILVRIHPQAFGGSAIPLALEVIEAERLVEQYSMAAPLENGNVLKAGIERDAFDRPVAYWFRPHPGNMRTVVDYGSVERVPAEFVIHLRILERFPQGRGEPWLHAVARKLDDLDGYTDAEIRAARGAATYMASIESDSPDSSDMGGTINDDGSQVAELTPGLIARLRRGEKMNFYSPDRPNSGAEPFLRYMLREFAAGAGLSYEAVSRDYSQSNYSASRLSLLDDRDTWRILQGWFITHFRERVHRIWIRQAVLAGAITGIDLESYGMSPARYEAAEFKPRGWSWVDPQKEVKAAADAVRNGFTTVTEVINLTGNGQDFAEVMEERAFELKQMAELGLKFDTDPSMPAPKDPAAPGNADQAGEAGAGGDQAAGAGDGQQNDGAASEGRIFDLRPADERRVIFRRGQE